jgi:trimethylamine--corrinoid protein Co-methyltransferase
MAGGRGALKILTRRELSSIHSATMSVLEGTGVAFKCTEALRVLDRVGAAVDYEKEVAKFPESLIKRALTRVPGEFTFRARDRAHDLRIGEGATYYTNGFGATNVLELKPLRRRLSTLRDLAEFTRIADYLGCVHYPITHCIPQDVPKRFVEQYVALVMMENTSKHIYSVTFSLEGARDLIRMGTILAGGEEEFRKKPEIINSTVCPTSPLRYSPDASERAMEFSKHRVPFGIWPAPMAGATAPATLAGTLVVQNAEILAGIVLSQAVGEGTPILYGVGSSVMDMRYGTPAYASPELGLMNIAAAQLARYYRIPSYGTGGTIDSKLPDQQAAYESTLSNVLCTLAGVDVIHDGVYGILESGMTASKAQFVICHEIVEMVERVARGIEVNDETLAVDVVSKMGPGGGFLAQRHTLEHFRKEHWIPHLTDRSPRSEWEQAGSKDVVERAEEEANRILKTHQPEPLEGDVRKELEEFVRGRVSATGEG